jgi:flagella basal body P-ring formation protein FlgA
MNQHNIITWGYTAPTIRRLPVANQPEAATENLYTPYYAVPTTDTDFALMSWRMMNDRPLHSTGEWWPLMLITAAVLLFFFSWLPAYADEAQDVGKTIPVAERVLMPGELITAEDLRSQTYNRPLPNNTVLDKQDLVGMEVLRRISAGVPIYPRQVRIPPVVRQGEPVNVSFNKGAIALTTLGRALEDGMTGQQIKLRNDDSNLTIVGVVTGPNQVEAN